jgi:hypothetical protein
VTRGPTSGPPAASSSVSTRSWRGLAVLKFLAPHTTRAVCCPVAGSVTRVMEAGQSPVPVPDSNMPSPTDPPVVFVHRPPWSFHASCTPVRCTPYTVRSRRSAVSASRWLLP